MSDTDICPTRTFVRKPVRNFADICPTRTFVRQSHFKFILKTISHVKGAISGDYRTNVLESSYCCLNNVKIICKSSFVYKVFFTKSLARANFEINVGGARIAIVDSIGI